MTSNHFAWFAALLVFISSFVYGTIDWFRGNQAEANMWFLKTMIALVLVNQYAKLIDKNK